MTSFDELTRAAEAEWLEAWTVGPTEAFGTVIPPGSPAPDLELDTDSGAPIRLSHLWAEQAALVMFWRHFGCGCGLDRAERLRTEYDDYLDAGLNPVIVAQGEPERAAWYRVKYEIPCPILCDPEHEAYRAYGIGQWAVEQVLFDTPPHWWGHSREIGADFQQKRREQDRFMVDDAWRATAEFVVGTDGVIGLSYAYQYCEDFPDPRVLTTAARLL